MSGVKSQLEELLAIEMTKAGLSYEREYMFHPGRKWRFDFAFPERMIAVELDGGTWIAGRHQRPDGYEKDCEKMNEAAMMGWCVLRFTGKMYLDGRAMSTIRRALG